VSASDPVTRMQPRRQKWRGGSSQVISRHLSLYGTSSTGIFSLDVCRICVSENPVATSHHIFPGASAASLLLHRLKWGECSYPRLDAFFRSTCFSRPRGLVVRVDGIWKVASNVRRRAPWLYSLNTRVRYFFAMNLEALGWNPNPILNRLRNIPNSSGMGCFRQFLGSHPWCYYNNTHHRNILRRSETPCPHPSL